MKNSTQDHLVVKAELLQFIQYQEEVQKVLATRCDEIDEKRIDTRDKLLSIVESEATKNNSRIVFLLILIVVQAVVFGYHIFKG